jgi:tetratricopeptide (TPR) repeat protein
VHASNHARFEEAYKGIARELALPRFDDPNANTLHIVSKWLSDDANGPWLMVLDNVDDMEMFFVNGQQSRTALVDFLPRSLNGLMLITTRDRRVGERLANREKPIAVLPFGMHDAERLLRSKLPDCHEWNEAESMELLEALGFLPLAITQAVAYISEEEVTLAHYLGLLRSGDSNIKDLFAQDYYDPGRDSEIQNSIFLTWKISFDQIRKQKPRAADVLSLMAVLDRQSISEILLRKEDEEKVSFDTAIGTLKAFSLITTAKKEAAFGMHRLVQLSMQWWLERKHALVEYQQRALGAVSTCCPSSGDYENWAAWEAISPHIEVVLGYIFETEHCLLKRASILNNAAWYDVMQGRYGTANKKGMEALAIRQRSLGKEHPSTLASMSNLANALWCQGKYGEVEEMQRLVLKGREKVLGGEHPNTLMSMNNLAVALGSRGRCEEAEEMHRLVLKGREKVLGKEHLDTLMSMHNLATVLECQGKYEKAEEMHRRALRVMEKVPGKEHPDTLMSMNNLALVLVGQGRYEEAEELYQQVLRGKEKMLGPEHPSTLMSMNNLAEAARSLGKYGEAEKAHRVTLEMREKILGKEHPDTLMSLSNLASVLECQDKCEEAEGTHRRALGVRTEVLAKEYWLH